VRRTAPVTGTSKIRGFAVITGFNTDVKHAQRVYHVQTEDRGLANPVVESLVYVGGEILLSKKSPYRDLIRGDRVDEKALREMMDLQHRRMIEAVRRGRLDGEQPPDTDWDDETLPSNASRVSPAAVAAVAAILSAPREPLPGSTPEPPPSRPAPGALAKPSASPPAKDIPSAPKPRMPRQTFAAEQPASSKPSTAPQPAAVTPPAPAAPPAKAAPPAPPAPLAAPAPRPKAESGVRSLDQVIVDYLASEAASEHLEVTLVTGGELVAGESVSLTVRAMTSLMEKPVGGAHVSIRVVSTVKPPHVLFRGVTGNDGLVKATCVLPDVGTGNAALIIAASSSLGNNEVKQLIRKKRG
jgi:hypothetical protein